MRRIFLFAQIYFVQGVALAYFQNFQKPYLNGQGISPQVIGLLTGILLLPFVFKIFLGLLSDRVNLFRMGHRRPYIIIGLLLGCCSFLAAGFISPSEHFFLFSGCIVMGSFSVTLFDSTTDGLAIETTPESEHGRIQGIMVGSRAAAFIILSLVFGFIVQRSGYFWVFALIAAAMLIPAASAFSIKEPGRPSGDFDWSAFRVMITPRFGVFALYAILYSAVSFGVDGQITLYLAREFHAPESMIGNYGALRGIGACLGALLGGFVMDRIGHRQVGVIALVCVSIAAAFLGFAPSINWMYGLGIVWGMAWAFQETVFFAVAMDIADVRIAASMFAISMAISNFGTAGAEAIFTGLAAAKGYSLVFWTLASFNILTIGVLLWLFRVRKKDEINASV